MKLRPEKASDLIMTRERRFGGGLAVILCCELAAFHDL
jgi:hypothetical protein